MDVNERVLTLLAGENPDHVSVLAADTVRLGSPGGWVRRLTDRGLGLIRRICPYRPYFNFPPAQPVFIPGIRWITENYIEDRRIKMRYTLVTSAGSLTSVVGVKFTGTLAAYAREEPFIKQRADWRVITCLFRQLTRVMAPNYEEVTREQDTLGSRGIVLGYLTKTSFPRAWIQLASPEQAIVDFSEMPEEVCEFLEAEREFHKKAAEIAAGSPAKVLNFYDNLTDMVSPRLFEAFCLPTYRLYADAISGSGKILACHMDGRLAHLKNCIASSPVQLIDSLTVPPVGNVPLTEVREAWPTKIIFINCPPHFSFQSQEDVRQGYLQILDEWGDNRLAIEYVEDLPENELEPHLSAALDACGY
jgi:hypothetical protein